MRFILISLIASLMFLGCAEPSVKKEQQQVNFENTNWKLISYGKNRMAVPKKAWISFKDGKYSGYAGCNGMGGEYILDIKNNLELKAGVSTMMACDDMARESMFRELMSKVNRYEIKENILYLFHNNNNVLNFKIK